jgi:antitoxin (DNA-binding transcriptional repressor) of toxin-antitoxin stability system
MKTFTYSEARQQFSTLLDEARRAGRVQIRRRDGQLFVIQPAKQERSPLDVPGVDAGLAEGESLSWLRDERDDSATRLLGTIGLEPDKGKSTATASKPGSARKTTAVRPAKAIRKSAKRTPTRS